MKLAAPCGIGIIGTGHCLPKNIDTNENSKRNYTLNYFTDMTSLSEYLGCGKLQTDSCVCFPCVLHLMSKYVLVPIGEI